MGAFVKPLDKVDDFWEGEIAGAENCRWLHIYAKHRALDSHRRQFSEVHQEAGVEEVRGKVAAKVRNGSRAERVERLDVGWLKFDVKYRTKCAERFEPRNTRNGKATQCLRLTLPRRRDERMIDH